MATDLNPALNLQMAAREGRSFYTRVCALGFGLIALTGIITLSLSIAGGSQAGDAFFGLIFVVVGLLVGGLVWRRGRWTLVLAAVMSFALLGLIVPFSIFTLAHPESAPDFVPSVVALSGSLFGFVGSIGAIVQWRRQTVRAHAIPAERLAVGGWLGALAVASVLSIVVSLANRTVVSADAKVGAASVQMKNIAFAPNALLVPAGGVARLVVKNNDATLHTFTLPAAGVDVSVPPGSEKVIEFKAPAAGTYQWYCIPHSSVAGGIRAGMVGTLQSQ